MKLFLSSQFISKEQLPHNVKYADIIRGIDESLKADGYQTVPLKVARPYRK